MKRSIVVVLSFCFAIAIHAQTNPTPTCEKTLGVTWTDIKQCMNELHVAYPDQFAGAAFGYVPPGTTQPVISTAGTGFGTEAQHMNTNPDDDPILWLGSISKIFTHSAALVAAEQTGIGYGSTFASIPGASQWLVDGDFYRRSRALKSALTVKQVLTMSAGFRDSTADETDDSPFRDPDEIPFYQQPSMNPAAAAQCFATNAGTTDPQRQYLEEVGLFAECIYLPGTNEWRNGRNTFVKDAAQHLMRYPMREEPISPNLYSMNYSNRSSYMAAWLIEQRTGQHANQYIKSTLFQPLGMSNTFSIPATFPSAPLNALNEGVTASQVGRITHMLNKANGLRNTNTAPEGVRPCNGDFWCDVRNWRLFWAAGGTYSTPRDLLTFMTKLGDNQIPAFSATTRTRLFTDQLLPQQSAAGKSRTGAFAYARNGVVDFVAPHSEGEIYHNGYPGASLAYDPNRDLAWFFGTQRVMHQKEYFQAGAEQFAEGRIFSKMLTSMVENVRPDNLDFHFDAARALRFNLFPYRYGASLTGTSHTNGYFACGNTTADCSYVLQQEYNACGTATQNQWHDLSSQNRTMSISAAGGDCPWPGNGSRTINAANQQLGPFRLRIDAPGEYATVSTPAAPTAFTMSAWVQPRTTANNTILTRTVFHPSGDLPTWQIAVENGRLVANLWDTAGKRTVIGSTVTPNAWYHVVAKATQNGALSLYVNGVPSGASVPVGTFLAASSPSYSVGYYTVNAPGFDVAALNVYNQEHTAADITRNCNGLKYRFPGMTCQ